MRARSSRTKREAEAWQATVEHELREGTYRDRSVGEVKFAEIAEEWIATRTDIAPSSRHTYRAALDRHVLPKWGRVTVARIGRREIATVAGRADRSLGSTRKRTFTRCSCRTACEELSV
jgi:hypothetical protein